MLEKIISNPELNGYITAFNNGDIVFLEGDDTQDLFILISGKLEIMKGNKKISEINTPGDLFGEMSVLLGGKRTATAKAVQDVKALRIPKSEITGFLNDFPEIASDITKILARRLDETSQVLYGLKEFCDQLPDAVTVTDKEGRILTWNSVAEKMYGRPWGEMHHKPVDEIYEESDEYTDYIEEVKSRYSVREKILTIRHPEKGIRYISTSTTVLYDGHHNYQGLLSIGRDVTRFREMEKRYRRVGFKIIPILLVVLIAVSAVFFNYNRFSGKPENVHVVSRREFRNQLGKDFILLKSLISEPFRARDRINTNRLMEEFIRIQEIENIPYKGLVLLDENLNVFDYRHIKGDGIDESKIIGGSYSGIDFGGSSKSLHRVLKLYRADKAHPMGQRAIEVAFEYVHEDKLSGWIIFQIDDLLLKEEYDMDENDLKKFRF